MRVILDMDTGVDDAVALILAMNSPELEIEAVTTVAGNAPVAECARNSVLIAELMERWLPPPVAIGASRPLTRPLVTAPEVHGHDGLGGLPNSLPTPHTATDARPAHELIAAAPLGVGDGITLIATGPLTNLALALRSDRTRLASYDRIIVMGGAFKVPGNTGPVAEFNFYVDPEAAEEVLNAGLPVTVVPLDATTRTALSRAEVEAAMGGRRRAGLQVQERPGRNLAAVLYRALDYYMSFQLDESGLDGGFMHDAIAVAAAFRPSIIETAPATVHIVKDGPQRGRSVLGPPIDGRTVGIAWDLDAEGLHGIIQERVLSPLWGGAGDKGGSGIS